MHQRNPDIAWIGWFLFLNVFTWVVARAIADANLDGYADMLENFAWGQAWEWGSAKHPPLFAWITGAWFFVFPRLDTAYHLLSYTNVAVGLIGVYQLARTIGRPDLALPAVILLCMAFPYSTLAAKFNANSILLSVWPWVVFAWVRSISLYGRCGALWSVALGVLCALAMLGKYFSGVLLLSIFFASWVIEGGRRWLGSFKPWLALVVFALCLTPHVMWLIDHDWVTLRYVGEQSNDEGNAWRYVVKFAFAPVAYWLFPWLICAWICAPESSHWSERMRGWPMRLIQSWRPMGWNDSLFWVAMLPWVITLAFGVSGFVELSMPWAIPIGFGFSLLWLRNLNANKLRRSTQVSFLKTFVVWCFLVLIVSPWYAWRQGQDGTDNYYLPRREAAKAILEDWHIRHPNQTLAWVGGEWAENALLAFYGDAKLRVIPGVPNQFPATINPLLNWRQEHGLLLCPLGFVDDPAKTSCPAEMKGWLSELGQVANPVVLTVQSTGRRFPLKRPFEYMVFHYQPLTP